MHRFLGELDRLKKLSGSLNEQTIRPAFRDLLRDWSRGADLHLLEEAVFETGRGTKVYPDGTIVHDLRVPHGYWEAKDTNDDLDAEIEKKNRKGYPTSNIVYENAAEAVLWQNGGEAMRADMTDPAALSALLTRFFAWERPEVRDWRQAVRQFQTDLPAVVEALREKIAAAYADNAAFAKKASEFLDHAKATINPAIGEADVREMLIQHVLTEEIFNHVFNESDFHRENNVAKTLYELERLFFRKAVKRDTLRALEPYYAAIRAAAASITSHAEKQRFLKVIYEGFYQTYNPKAADRLGVVYTPNEIVRFMIDGADWLCREHFGRGLIDEDVHILDPCTGTGTYVCELMESFRGDRAKLARKYKTEVHANEVAILPYYVANLNIEATYAEITGQYAEYENLCFVDTLDNVAALGLRAGHQHDIFAAVSDENIKRVREQNQRTISVVIGNPPYNANQQNENENNKNRTYARIDESIKSTYVKQSTAQKTKVYDMYARFFRWATDRLGEDGVVAFVTNRSFIDSRTFDGFRRAVASTFDEIVIVDLGGDVRANPRLSGTKHNVFGIQTGVAISFMVRRARKSRKAKPPARIRYARRPEDETAEDKLAFPAATPAERMRFETITPSKRGNWIDQVENEWDDLLPLADKKVKSAKPGAQQTAVFKLFSLGVVTARDDWTYDHSQEVLEAKFDALDEGYEETRQLLAGMTVSARAEYEFSDNIKWTRSTKQLARALREQPERTRRFVESTYRPFTKRQLGYSYQWNEMRYQLDRIFDPLGTGHAIMVSGTPSSKPFTTLATNHLPSYDCLGRTQCLPRYRYNDEGDRLDNVTDWALRKFRARYGKAVTKDDVFAYCYAVLHDPVYRETYAINLRRELPRVPLYADFVRWRDWGRTLLDLHVGYETQEPYPLMRIDEPNPKRAEGTHPRVILRSDRDAGTITLDADTQLTGVPDAAWDYVLGNRTAIDWVLDQHKEKRVRDETVRRLFDAYRFADHKERVAGLLARVVRVSVETVTIVEAMKTLPEGARETKPD